ncbi:TPA: hypothetical protein DDW35_02325 [Candidatus Sumerlaeota bacterium]|nr:hypothetical protein [Candidatus Sumerlaeota bacterium]
MMEFFAAFVILSPILSICLFIAWYKASNSAAKQRMRADVSDRDNVDLRRKVADMEYDVQALEGLAKSSKAITQEVAVRLLKDSVKHLSSKLTPQNFTTTKSKTLSLFEYCEKKGVPVEKTLQTEILNELKKDYEEVVRKDFAKQEQLRIREKIREEQREEAERFRELDRLGKQEQTLELALQRAINRLKDEHAEEVERLREQLREAQERLQRAKSQAELTKAGYVYVISNIGSFGENVYKVGMTRRLEPMDRVRELGDASVPFPFDVHMMISCEDAPALENALHKEIRHAQVNKVNPRKEFFRVELNEIVRIVQKNQGRVDYVAEPEALEYRNSINMTKEDEEFVGAVMGEFDQEN